MAALLEPVAR
uniref:Uncharacterized protein n=1 Tax=Anguilla anguilla TaxID=7936 RepID=A0A0E9V4W8_ANGAN